jgi:hypothetical protein
VCVQTTGHICVCVCVFKSVSVGTQWYNSYIYRSLCIYAHIHTHKIYRPRDKKECTKYTHVCVCVVGHNGRMHTIRVCVCYRVTKHTYTHTGARAVEDVFCSDRSSLSDCVSLSFSRKYFVLQGNGITGKW